MELTLATAEDAAEIAEVKVVGWRTTYAAWVPEDVLARLADPRAETAALTLMLRGPGNFAVLSREKGRLVGFALCLRDGPDEPLLDSLHVLPEARGRGVGSALLRRVAEELRDRGAATLTLTVVEQNEGARRLYERLGATRTAIAAAPWAPEHVREAHMRWDDVRVMLPG